MVAPASGKAPAVVPVASVVVVVVATVVVADDVVDVDVESTVIVVIVIPGSATFGEHAVARASTHISQTPGLPNPRRAMCALISTRAFWSGPGPSAVDDRVVCRAHSADGYAGRHLGSAALRSTTNKPSGQSLMPNSCFSSWCCE